VSGTPARPGPGPLAVVDAGGTTLKGALVGADGSARARRRVATGAGEGEAAVRARIASLLGSLVAEAAADGRPPPLAGVAVPGVVDESSGTVVLSANLGFRHTPLASLLGEEVGLPVVLSHDVRAAALAERRLGAGAGRADFLFLSLGTGIAAAAVLGGEIRRGVHGLAGEIGHLVVDEGGDACGCGGRGCLETVASAAAIARRYAAAGGPAVDGAEAVFARRRSGDAAAEGVVQVAVAALAAALLACQSVLDVDLVVIGGGLAGAGAELLEPLAAEMAAGAGLLSVPELRTAALGDDAGCVGAALAARVLERAAPGALAAAKG